MIGDLAARVGAGWSEYPVGLAAAVVLLLCLVVAPIRDLLIRFRLLVAGGAIVLGLLWAWSLRWASDDAFISLRYAENFAHGHGLVFNIGERVEGYTDFLWVVLISLGIRLGLPAPELSIVLSLASFVGLLVLVTRVSKRDSFPLAVILTAASYTVASFATGGLETVFAAACVLLAFHLADADRPLGAGLAGLAAALSHPDHILFGGALGLAMLLSSRSIRGALKFAAPFLLIGLPWFIWRWRYYGDLMPNTYYAKSGGDSYFTQGGTYLLVSAVGQGLLVISPLAIAGWWSMRRTLFGRFVAIAVPLYLFYVAKIGGDFMLGRLLTPVFPLVFLAAERGLATLPRLPAAILASLAIIPMHLVKPGEVYRGIADERTFTPMTQFSPMVIHANGFMVGKALHETFTAKDLHPTMGILALGMASYYSQLPTFDELGLTSRSVAHQLLFQRGRPGHEKFSTLQNIFEAGVEISKLPLDPEPYAALTRIQIGPDQLFLRRADPVLMRAANAPNYALHVDGLIRQPSPDPTRRDCDVWHANAYYFSANDDRERRTALAALSSENAFLLTNDLKAVPTREEHFDDLAQWSREGSATDWVVPAAPLRQMEPYGQKGSFIDTFTRDGDASTGALVSPKFVVKSDFITFDVGGGSSAQLGVSLLVDGKVVRHATGCDSERLGRRAWDVRELKNAEAQIRIEDGSTGGWGHLLVDELTEWELRPE